MSRYGELTLGSKTTVELVRAQLRGWIVEGRIKPGERLVESVIAAEASVSRNTVREALRGLEECRLVTYHPNRGFSVSVIDTRDVEEIYGIRLLVELGALDRLKPCTPAQRAVFQDSIGQLERCIADRDYDGIVDADLQFHLAIVQLTESSRLHGFMTGLIGELRLALVRYDQHRNAAETTVAPHVEILAQLVSGDRTAAKRALRSHLVDTRAQLVEHFRHP